ncbi:histidine phosphatase family protein [Leptolyngbya sp. CCY15150]|uniref:histidine phosphatase family protein n=1 Tax=Leptolyngbya sp. CCY15150 TaxID=2767772 RepID=UPI00194FDACF|nr:histidine phosphatase family protein [Leptolyngbya sp. CCY15150]
MQLLFIRHGQATGNQAGRMMGHGQDGLSEMGRRQVQALGRRLMAESYQPTAIYSSPLERAKQTAIALAGMVDPSPQPIRYRDALCEFQNGIFQGLTWVEAQQQYPDLCRSLEASLAWQPIPGAETLQSGRDRAAQFMQEILHHHSEGDRLCIVTHHWILQQLISVLLGSDRTWGFAADYTARFEFHVATEFWSCRDQNRWNSDLWRIVRFGDRQHLADLDPR